MSKTSYAVFHPLTGSIAKMETEEEAIQKFVDNLIELAIEHFHDCCYSTVITNDDGSETWNPNSKTEITTYEKINTIHDLLKARILELSPNPE
jgi:hypothetical protein